MFGLKESGNQPRTEEATNQQAKKISVTLILGFLLPLLIVGLIYIRSFKQITDSDTMDIAQVARNLAAGQGFTTSVVRPLATTIHPSVRHMPDMIHGPAYPVAMQFAFAGSPSDKRVFITAALFFLLTIPVLYTLAKAMFNQRVAQLSVFAFATSVFITNTIRGAGPGMMAAFVFTGLCLALFRFAQAADGETGVPLNTRRVITTAFVSGLLFALCYLTEYMLLFAFLPVLGFVYAAGRKARGIGIGAFLVGFAVLALPWMIRNQMVTGHAFFGLRALEIGMGTTAHPTLSLYRTTVPQTVLGLLQESTGEIFKKLLQGFSQAYQLLPMAGQILLMPFFIAGLFYSFRRTGVNALRGMLIAAFLFVVVFGSLYAFQAGVVAAFVPVLLAFAAAYFVRILTDAKVPGFLARTITVGAYILLAFPLVSSLLLNPAAKEIPHQVEPAVARDVAPDTPIMTDRPFEMAWYGGRTSIWLPYTEKDVQNLDRSGSLKAIYLSANLAPGMQTMENYDQWRGMWNMIYAQATQGNYARINAGTFKDFILYRDLPDEKGTAYLRTGSLLLLRPGAVRPQS